MEFFCAATAKQAFIFAGSTILYLKKKGDKDLYTFYDELLAIMEAEKSKLALAIHGQVIGEWFKEQFDKLFSSIRRTVVPHRKEKGLGL